MVLSSFADMTDQSFMSWTRTGLIISRSNAFSICFLKEYIHENKDYDTEMTFLNVGLQL